LLTSNPSGYETFNIAVDAFEANAGEHGLENLIYAIDPSAFYEQTGGGAVGTVLDTAGAYLVPDSTLGYLATGLDYGLLSSTGLGGVGGLSPPVRTPDVGPAAVALEPPGFP
jgi:hypothetical protein